MGIGDFISDLFGSKNKNTAEAPQVQVDPNAYQYGGRAGGAEQAAQRATDRSNEYNATMGGATRDAGAMYGQAAQDRANAGQARGMQQDAASMARDRATGAVPSIAQMQTDRGMAQVGQQAAMARQQAFAQQSAQASSARGAASLALAQQGAANNISNAGQAITQGQMAQQADMGRAGAVAAANERLAAEQAYAQQAGAIRGQDYQGQAASLQGAQQQQSFALGLGGLAGQQDQLANNVNQAQLAAQMNQQAQQSANQLGAAGINAGVGGQNAAMNQQNAMGAVNMGTSLFTNLAKSDERAKVPLAGFIPMRADGGPVQAGQPYVVGERGPEVVVPQQSGTVVPNHALSTWGTSGQAIEAQDEAAAQARVEAEAAQAAYNQAAQEKNGYQRDADHYAGIRRVSAQLGQDAGLSEDDLRRERIARYMTKQKPTEESKAKAEATGKAADEKAKVANGEAVPTKPEGALSKALGSVKGAVGEAFDPRSVDVGYHGPAGGFVPPQLLSLPGRALGGPVAGGKPYLMGEAGPELVVPGGLQAGDKIPIVDPNKATATQYASNPGSYAMESDGKGNAGIDVLGTFKAQNDRIDEMRTSPSGGAGASGPGGMMVSDDRAKLAAAWDEGHAAAVSDVKKLAGKSPAEVKALAKDRPVAAAVRDVKADAWDEGQAAPRARRDITSFQRNPDGDQGGSGVSPWTRAIASFAMPSPASALAQGLVLGDQAGQAHSEAVRGRAGAVQSPETLSDERVKKPSKLDRDVAELERSTKREWDARLAQGPAIRSASAGIADLDAYVSQMQALAKTGPSVDAVSSRWAGEEAARSQQAADSIQRGKPSADPMANAARSMRASTYAYKPEQTPPEQRPGEANVGPMAQTMAANPITATAVKKDPATGLLMIDQSKMLKVLGGVAAHQQSQIDTLASRLRKKG